MSKRTGKSPPNYSWHDGKWWPSLLSKEVLDGAAVIVERIRRREAASMERLRNSGRLTGEEMMITINTRG